MDTLTSLLGRSGFLPHGYCFTWSPGLLWSMVVSDAIIACAYFSIPVAIISYVRRRPEASTTWLAWLFSAFIFACGVTHVMDIWTIWQPDYAVQALSKMLTAGISLVTAIMLWPLIPRALKIPSVQQLQHLIGELKTEVGRRRSTEDQLAATQQSLAVTLASIDAGFIAADRAGKVTHMNAVAEFITGWTQQEAKGQDLFTVFERESRPEAHRLQNPVDLMLAQGVNVDMAHRVEAISRTGTRTPLELKADLTRNDDGEVTGLAMVFRDQSRTVRAEAESRQLAAIVESSNDAIIGVTLDGRITSWNRAAQSIFGYPADEAVGQQIQMLIPQDRCEEETRIISELAQGHLVPAFDTVRLTRSGEPLNVHLTISPIKDGEGCVVGASKIARDVTLHRRAEADLRDSEERLRFTLEAAHIGDWEVDLTTGATWHSARHAQCFGYAEPQMDWSFDKFIEHVHPADRAEVEQTFQLAVSERQDWRVQCRVVWPDHEVHWISIRASMQCVDGKAIRMLGIVSDITEQREAEEARFAVQRLEAENRQIQEANRLKSQFLANMSHELRTPLNAIIGFSDLLHSGYVKPDSAKSQEFLGYIGTSGRHLLQLINDVLDLSKVESGKLDFFPEPLDLPVMLQEVQDILHTALTRKNIRISAEIDADLTDLTLDPARLKQVLYNYLSNAIKFTDPGGHVAVRAMGQGPDHFRIEVEDTGIGVSAADLSRLFEDFQQLDSRYSKQHEGTGLGLALTRRLVQAQGGHVGVSSTLGVGSVFYVVLNRTHGMDTQRATSKAQGLSEPDADLALVIDDDHRDHALLVDALSQAGFKVDHASDGPTALQRARDTAYDALTLKLDLKDKRGLEVLDYIRSSGASHASPVLGVTMPTDLNVSATFAIANVLCKPIRSDEIVSAMALFKLPGNRRAQVMVIDDEQSALDVMQATLRSIDVDAVCFQDGRLALQELDRHRPEAIVLDLMMPGFDGFQVLDALQRLPAWREVPVFIWTSMLLTDEEYAMLARSARAILIKGGGGMQALQEGVRRWRQPKVAAGEHP